MKAGKAASGESAKPEEERDKEPGQEREPTFPADRWDDPPASPHASSFNPDYWPKY
ncbi:hypothetical protein Asphe3_29950 [Pseudarthrobacter phenanthrenivorans Sphe3]|uniref:Uncharacterized protein n=1 Tax=Pseudarthrobacter phenanthrenivorans (strain DSM 18606 / JCM 16027 / LMG 23796 / Sphe3) TaxID=930171 RepID=F0MBW5_PSEPM|nr:hypothetical protein [Pseudarthrobacter phenanthrenivorans]ADX74106.1 hypothetical protein Asphe3_29950 [Pseudarthrobacter phenanthrenivorans Sphe3]